VRRSWPSAAGSERRNHDVTTTAPSKPASATLPHLTTADRIELGKGARRVAPRATQGAWTRPSKRADPVAILEEQALSRVPDLVPIRYGRMLASPFTFYRG